MPTMDDPFSKRKRFALGDYRLTRLVLSPEHWKKFSSPSKLIWGGTKFKPSNAKNVPDGKSGVYSFVVQPNIAEHPACAYLMYVGKAEKQSLRTDLISIFVTKLTLPVGLIYPKCSVYGISIFGFILLQLRT